MPRKSIKSKKHKNLTSSIKRIIELAKSLKKGRKKSDFDLQIELDLQKYSREDIHLGI
jgi:hypothetical protein